MSGKLLLVLNVVISPVIKVLFLFVKLAIFWLSTPISESPNVSINGIPLVISTSGVSLTNISVLGLVTFKISVNPRGLVGAAVI